MVKEEIKQFLTTEFFCSLQFVLFTVSFTAEYQQIKGLDLAHVPFFILHMHRKYFLSRKTQNICNL